MLITHINKTAVLNNPFGDTLKGILTLITEDIFYLDKDMCTTLISYNHPRCPVTPQPQKEGRTGI